MMLSWPHIAKQLVFNHYNLSALAVVKKFSDSIGLLEPEMAIRIKSAQFI